METSAESRFEQRLTYRWPVCFSEDLAQGLFQGLMVDISSGGIAFTYKADQCCLEVGQSLTVRFSLPRFDEQDPGATVGIMRTGRIRWATPAEPGTLKVGLQFDTPLSLKPAEQAALSTLYRQR
jgi:hypothetical protein